MAVADLCRRLAPAASVTAMGVLLALFVRNPTNETVLGRAAYVLAAGATGLLVVAAWTGALGALARPLSFGPLRAVGRVSYGLYLWHFPVFARVNLVNASWPRWSVVATSVLVTSALTAASFHLVERPALRLKARFRRRRDPVPVAA
ncbi:hypothetical protein BH10ACT1_BH10ACT1_07740 [soil metagenome]